MPPRDVYPRPPQEPIPPLTHPMSPPTANPRMALSLMELLLCLGIIAALLALAFPALSYTTRQREAYECVSRLRAVGASLAAYSTDSNGYLPARYLGNDRPQGAEVPPVHLRTWISRLVNLGYASRPDIFFCPSFTPGNNPQLLEVAYRKIMAGGTLPAYGLRIWVPPGLDFKEWREEERRASTIATPSDFFLVADSYWSELGSQGYGITPGAVTQAVHLRHFGKANALFADGHVEAKPQTYFADLEKIEVQGRYSNGSLTRPGNTIFCKTANP